MGMFGKYLIKVTCTNGEWGYYMDIDDGYIQLTRSVDSAEHFMTRNGARGFAEQTDWSLPTIGKDFSWVESVDLMIIR